MFKYFFFYILFSSISLSQTTSDVRIKQEGGVFLFGETHFVKEKYREIKSFVIEHFDSVSSGETATIFFELPFSLNYAFSKMKTEGDTSLFYDWFNHLYQKKDQPPSYFWTDCRDFILELKQYAENKGIDLKLKAIDTELEYRRTAFVLSSFQNKLDTRIDSFLNVEYMRNDSTEREFLLNYINESLHYTNSSVEVEILKKLRHSLLIDCSVCLDRDKYMYNNFLNYFNKNDALSIGTFGLDHITEQHDFSAAGEFFKMKYKIDTVAYKSFYTLLKDELNKPVFRIGILSLNQAIMNTTIQKPQYYNHIMLEKEREYIESLLKNKKVIRIHPFEHEELRNLSTHLDYIIVYKISDFR